MTEEDPPEGTPVARPASKFPTKMVVGGGIVAAILFLLSRRGKGLFGMSGKDRFTGDVRRLLTDGTDPNATPTIDIRMLDRGALGNFLFVKPGDTEGYTLDNLVTITRGKVDGKNLRMILRFPGDVLQGNVVMVRNRLKAENIPFGEPQGL